MHYFQNILVGIEINPEGELTAGSQVALEQALAMAQAGHARLHVMHVIHAQIQVADIMSLQPQSPVRRTMALVDAVLDKLKKQLESQHDSITFSACFGTVWRRLLEAVENNHHDLVVVGTRSRSLADRTFFGSLSNRLLRYCPCPVLAVKPQDHTNVQSVLVAHDLTHVGDAALRLAANLAIQNGAVLHILHVLEMEETKHFLGSVSNEKIALRKNEVHEQISKQCQAFSGDVSVQIHIGFGSAHVEILAFLTEHQIDLLCMGTIARSGIRGIVTGNTAENVLPWVRCSLLAVKPDDFNNPAAVTTVDEPLIQSREMLS